MPRNPQVTTEVSVVALKGSFPGDLGIELLELDDDSVTGRLLVDRRHLHPGGYVHGGVWVAFADTVAAWGTMRNLPSGDNFTTAELKVNVFASGFPGSHFDIDDEFAVGDKVVTRFTYHAVHSGEFQGIPPTGKQVAMTGITILRLAGGKIEENTVELDQLGLLQQLGVVPTPGQASQ